jgi:ubiquinone/menaquinone biosynthesis C-methylase UbiE
VHLKRVVISLAVLLVASAGPAQAQLAGRTADEWIRTLESPQRIQGLKIDETVAKLQIKPGQVVADIGAGSGVFEAPLANAVTPSGKVYAEDIDQGLLDNIARKNIVNVQPVLGGFTDPKLPAPNVDLAMINDVLHHIEDRAGYLKNLARYIRPGGRVAIIDFHPEKGGHRNQPDLQVTKDQANRWMADVGFKPIEDIDLFTDKYFIIYGR